MMSNASANQSETTAAADQPAGTHPSPTTGHEIELILARQLAGYLALAVVIVDPSWSVTYYNEPAEEILGRRFDEGGAIPWTAWSNAFHFTDEAGATISAEEIPVLAALRSRRVSYLAFWMSGLDGVRRHICAAGIPLVGNAGRFLGAVGIFNEIDE